MIEKNRLYAELKNKVKNLTYLNDMSQVISEALDLKSTIAKIIEITKTAFNAHLCSILLYDSKSGMLVTQPGAFFIFAKPECVYDDVHKDSLESLTAKAFREGKAHFGKDASQYSKHARDCGIKSAMVIPLIAGKEIIGVMRIGNSDYGIYGEKDIALVSMIASQAAIVIKNAKLYQELASCKVKTQ